MARDTQNWDISDRPLGRKPKEIIDTTEGSCEEYTVETLTIAAEVAVYRVVSGRTRKMASITCPEIKILASERPDDPDAWGAQVERYAADCERQAQETFGKVQEERAQLAHEESLRAALRSGR